MSYHFTDSNEKTRHFVYLDNNTFRILIREPIFWHNFFEFFEKEDPLLFHDVEFIFTWLQLLEAIDLGHIINTIKQSPLWKNSIEGKQKFKDQNNIAINNSLDLYFNTFRDVIHEMPELQQASLLETINNAISFAHAQANPLLKQTLLKCKEFIESNDYMNDLSYELGWAFITGEPFIMSNTQWGKRECYFDSLIAFWHNQLFLKGYELDFYRLLDRQYHSHVEHSGLQEPINKEFVHKLRQGNDLCDGQIIHYCSFGYKACQVIGITFDKENVISQRLAISKQSLIDLQRDVENWQIATVPGIILSLEKENHRILKATRIPFNTPFLKL